MRTANNTREVPSQAEKNATALRRYLGKMACVNNGAGKWGTTGAQIVEVRSNTLTLFKPACFSSSTAFAALVHCDDLQVTEMPTPTCAVQVNILAHGLRTIYLGNIQHWEERNAPVAASWRAAFTAPRLRGGVAFQGHYRRNESSELRQVFVYTPTEGNPLYTLATLVDGRETSVVYGNNVEISEKFAVVQIAYRAEGFGFVGGETGPSPEPLFLLTGEKIP